MTEWRRMSTLSRSATSTALRSGRTLKPITMAFDAADLHAIVAELRQRIGEHFRRSLHVRLDDDRQLLHAAFGELGLERLEREPRALRAERFVLRLHLPELRDLPGLGRVFQSLEGVARLRQPAQAEHFDRCRRRSAL